MGSNFAKMGNQKCFLFVTIQFVRYTFYFYLEGALKMNNKLKLISFAVISTFILAACNGGGNSSGDGQQIDADAVPPVAGDITLDETTASWSGSGVISMLGQGAVSAVGGQVALWLLERVTNGAFPPNNPAELISGISNQLNEVESVISAQNAYTDNLINTYQSEDNYSVIKNQYVNVIGSFYNKIGQFISQTNHFSKFPTITESNLEIAYNAFTFESSVPFESMILKAMSTKNNQNTLVNQTGPFSNLDTASMNLSCDTSGGKYNSLAPNNYPTPNLNLSYAAGQGCQIALVLQAVLNDFNNAQNTSLTNGTNAFYLYSSFSAGLDIFYLTMVNSLTQEYAIDQLRAYLGQFKNSSVGFPDYVTNVNSYKLALNDVTLAYTSRLSYLNTMFMEAKESAFNYVTTLAPAVNSASLQTQCGVTPQNIVSSVPANVDMLPANSSQYYWDGTNLKVNCSSNGGQLTTTTPVGVLCEITNSNIQANNGYISCGTSINNYLIMQDYSTAATVHNVEGDLPGQLSWINYSNVPNYTAYGSTAWFSQLYSFWSTGTLNVYYDPNYPITSNNLAQANTILQNQLDDNPTNYITTNVGFNVDVQPFAAIGLTYVGIPVMVSDGSHTFTLGAGAIHNYGSDNQGFMLLGCVPGDSNCQVGNFPNFTSTGNYNQNFNALIFKNGDIISMYNKYTDHYHGDYYLKAFYNGTAPEYITSAVTWQ